MINSSLLKNRIEKEGFTQKELSRRIGISESAFSLKINNRAYFNTLEVEALCRWLNLQKRQERIDIFFCESSQKRVD